MASLDHWKLSQFVTGEFLMAGVGYAELIPSGWNHWTDEQVAKVHDAMRADWAVHGAAIMAWWRGEHDRFSDRPERREELREWIGRRGRTEPWAATQFREDE